MKGQSEESIVTDIKMSLEANAGVQRLSELGQNNTENLSQKDLDRAGHISIQAKVCILVRTMCCPASLLSSVLDATSNILYEVSALSSVFLLYI